MTLFKLIHWRNPLTPLISVNGGRRNCLIKVFLFFKWRGQKTVLKNDAQHNLPIKIKKCAERYQLSWGARYLDILETKWTKELSSLKKCLTLEDLSLCVVYSNLDTLVILTSSRGEKRLFRDVFDKLPIGIDSQSKVWKQNFALNLWDSCIFPYQKGSKVEISHLDVIGFWFSFFIFSRRISDWMFVFLSVIKLKILFTSY